MLIDTHVHITLPNQTVLHHRLSLEEYIIKLNEIGGGKGVLFINPFDNKYCCPNSMKDERLHKSKIVNNDSRNYSIMCECCNSVHYTGEDVFRNDNIKLLQMAKDNEMYALAFLTAPNICIQNQVDFYEKNYPEFLGYKIHPTIMMFPADKLSISSKKTIVFHCGNDEYASPNQIMKFAENYLGNVIIAHFARFDRQSLIEISHMKNVWIDMSPFTFLFGLRKTKPGQLCDTWKDINCEDNIKMMFDAVARCVGVEKILFASDDPFGDLCKEKEFVDSLNLMDKEFYQIMEGNARCAFRI